MGAAPPAEQADRFAQLSAVTVAVEPLGAEVLLVLSVGGEVEVIARVGRDVRLKPGESVRVYLDTHAVHLFHPRTGQVLSSAGSSLPSPG